MCVSSRRKDTFLASCSTAATKIFLFSQVVSPALIVLRPYIPSRPCIIHPALQPRRHPGTIVPRSFSTARTRTPTGRVRVSQPAYVPCEISLMRFICDLDHYDRCLLSLVRTRGNCSSSSKMSSVLLARPQVEPTIGCVLEHPPPYCFSPALSHSSVLVEHVLQCNISTIESRKVLRHAHHNRTSSSRVFIKKNNPDLSRTKLLQLVTNTLAPSPSGHSCADCPRCGFGIHGQTLSASL